MIYYVMILFLVRGQLVDRRRREAGVARADLPQLISQIGNFASQDFDIYEILFGVFTRHADFPDDLVI